MATKKQLAELANVIATHQANITRLGEAWGQKICDALDDTDRALIARLKDLLADVKENYKVNTQKSIDQLEYIRSKIEEIRVRAFVKAEKELRAEAPDLIDNETKWSKRILSELTGEKASRFADLTPKQIDKVLNNGIIQNKPWADWWTYTASADVQRIANVVNAGVVQGFTIDQITRLIMGTKKGGYTDGVLSTTRASARNLARTMCSGLANQAKDEFYRQNDDVVIGVEWLDTLDGRTCPSCAGLSRRRWKTDEPHPVPPVHPSCRCVLLPVTELTDLGEDVPRPMANADFDSLAKEAYEEQYPNKKWEDLAYSTRKKYYYQAIKDFERKTGKPAYSQAPGSMKFKDYFEQMDEATKRKWLGKGKYELWKTGRFKVEDFIPPYPDKAMTVKQLKAADIESMKDKAPFGFGRDKNKTFVAKFDGKFTVQGKMLDKQMRKSGISDEARDEINWNHTLEMQRLCKRNPNVKSGSNWPGVEEGTRNMEIGSDPNTWEGCRQTVTHEYGHYVANSIFEIEKTHNIAEFEKAAVSDLKAALKVRDIEKLKGIADKSSSVDLIKDSLSKEMFGNGKFSELSFEQKWKITADADILGSISGGLYGFGHSSQVYLEDWYREAFANMYLAHKYNWIDFKDKYPALWAYMEGLAK